MTPVILMTAQASLQSAMQAVNRAPSTTSRSRSPTTSWSRSCGAPASTARSASRTSSSSRRSGAGTRGGGVAAHRQVRALHGRAAARRDVAPTDSTVLIQGESGTGKEVVARYIHELSSRERGPVPLDQLRRAAREPARERAVRPREGHRSPARCATSRASSPRRGAARSSWTRSARCRLAQVKLLRVLQEREVIPVGATEAIPVDVRIIAATNRDLEEEMRRGNFRCDLFYRLNVIALHLPPLRERRDDLPLLARAFLQVLAQESGGEVKALSHGSARCRDGLRVARQRARARERAGARRRPLAGPTSSSRRSCRSGSPRRRKEPLVAERPQPTRRSR